MGPMVEPWLITSVVGSGVSPGYLDDVIGGVTVMVESPDCEAGTTAVTTVVWLGPPPLPPLPPLEEESDDEEADDEDEDAEGEVEEREELMLLLLLLLIDNGAPDVDVED